MQHCQPKLFNWDSLLPNESTTYVSHIRLTSSSDSGYYYHVETSIFFFWLSYHASAISFSNRRLQKRAKSHNSAIWRAAFRFRPCFLPKGKLPSANKCLCPLRTPTACSSPGSTDSHWHALLAIAQSLHASTALQITQTGKGGIRGAVEQMDRRAIGRSYVASGLTSTDVTEN